MQLTIRGLSPELEQRLQQLAVEEKISLNKAALKLPGMKDEIRGKLPDNHKERLNNALLVVPAQAGEVVQGCTVNGPKEGTQCNQSHRLPPSRE